MNWIAALDILGAVGICIALLAVLWIRTHLIGGVAKLFLTTALLAYLFITAGNAVEKLGITGALDPYEDYAEILFFPFILLFVYSAWVKQEIAGRIEAQERMQQVNDVLRTVQQINELIVREDERQRLIERACEILVGAHGFRSAWLAVLDNEGQITTYAHANHGEVVPGVRNKLASGRFPNCAAKAIEQRGVMKVEQQDSLCEGCPLEEKHRAHPLLAARVEHAGRVHGVLVVYGEAGTAFPAEESALFQELADDLGLALHKFELEKQRAHLEAQFLQAQKMEAVGRLAGGIAHDFRNQLTVIGGYCDLLLSQTSEDSPWREQLKEVRNAANRAETLTGSLLSFSRKRILQPEVININDVLQGIAKPMASMMGDDVELTMALEEDLATTELDQSGLEQALMNLVANARDAMPAGGKLHIETENVELTESYARLHPDVPPGPYVLLVVSDTGVGMDKAMLDRIFEPFYTTKERGKGTGLGLSMVYGFVKQSGGAIHVYSEPGKGTTFKMYFPRRKAVSESKPAQPETEEKRPPGKETVLLVEDDELVRHLARRVLRQSGYTLLEAADPAEAKSIAKTHEGEIDLLLSDVVMPQGSGPELAEQLLEDRPNMKVLLMSGYTAEVIDRHGLSRLGADLLPKPFSTTALAQAVRRMLDTGTANAGKH